MRDAEPPRQIPLDLGGMPALSRQDLVVGAANEAAVAFLDGWRSVPPHVVVLAGPPGSGKSHLATIWQAETGAMALRADTALTGPVSAPVLIDDADLPPRDENALFHLLNAARAAGQPVLLMARRFPAAWGIGLPDLASRLQAATTIELREPDDILLGAVIVKLFADRQVDVDPQVVQYLVRRIERSIATAISVVERLDRRSLETKSRITRQLAAGVLDAMDAGQGALDL